MFADSKHTLNMYKLIASFFFKYMWKCMRNSIQWMLFKITAFILFLFWTEPFINFHCVKQSEFYLPAPYKIHWASNICNEVVVFYCSLVDRSCDGVCIYGYIWCNISSLRSFVCSCWLRLLVWHNILRLRQNGPSFVDDILNYLFWVSKMLFWLIFQWNISLMANW